MSHELTILGILCKLGGSTALAYRFILLKKLDHAYDCLRDVHPELDQNNWKKVFELLKDDVIGHGNWWALHKLDALQYCLIPIYAGFDVCALFFLSFAMFGSLQVFSIVIYQIMLVYIIQDPVDWNEWMSVLSLTLMSILVSIFAPTEDDIRHANHQWEPAQFSTSFWSIAWLLVLCVLKTYSFFALQNEIGKHIALKDDEKLSDLFQPRPLSVYNLLGPLHLATTGALFIIAVKFVLNLTSESDASFGIIGSIFAFIFVGIGCSCLAAHSYHDMIGELHSATVFPCFVLGQSAFAILSGIINFCEYPQNEVAFWFCFVIFVCCIMVFVIVMEVNEPVDQYKISEKEQTSYAGTQI